MMRYRLCSLVTVFLIFLSPVYADTSLSLACPATSTVGSTINCNVVVDSDIDLSAVGTRLRLSSNLELVKFTTDSVWQGTGDNGNIQLYTFPNQKGKVNLGVASIKVLENQNSSTGTISLENTTFYGDNFNGFNGKNVSFNIKVLSTNNDLSSITLDKGSLTPSFNKNTLNYQVTLDSSNVTIGAVSSDKKATVSGVGNKELKEGKNTFVITVTSEAGEKREYQIVITRPVKKQDNSEKKEDNIKNPSNNEEKKNSNTSSDTETSSSNQEKKDELKLRELVVDGYSLDFQKDKNTYSVILLNDEKKLGIKAIALSDDIKVTISGNENLKVGENKISILLEDKEGNKNTYTIIATKKSQVCVIKDIKVVGYQFNFDCNKYEYRLSIKDEDKLNIDVVPTNEDTKINIYHNDNLKDGDIITISVKYGDNEYQYLIKISKKEENSTIITDNKKVLILGGIVIVGLLYLVGRFILKKKFFSKSKEI